MESPSLTKTRDVALGTWFGGEQRVGLIILEVFPNLEDSMILFLITDPIPKPFNEISLIVHNSLPPHSSLQRRHFPPLSEEPIPTDDFFPL